MGKSVKMSDIAKALNVSIVTVSKALSDKKGVSAEMREKIKNLAEEMGYKQLSEYNDVAVQSYNIGILVSERYLEKYTSFYWELYQNIATQASQKDCFTLFEVLTVEDEKSMVCPKLLREKKVDGLILLGRTEAEYTTMIREEKNIPVLFLDFYDEHSESDSVISDSYYGMYLVTNYLFQMGHRKIGFVGTPLATSSITDRYFGYQKSMMEHGIKVEKEWIINDREIECGEVDITLPKELPSALVCNCDFVASIVIEKLKERGLRVPEDISVAGFDNYIYPGLCDIGITTYEVDVKGMAKTSLGIILKKIKKESYRTGIRIVEGRLVVKDSVSRI
jgi:DNA-binding LacI/PurR family transcriptional regulator